MRPHLITPLDGQEVWTDAPWTSSPESFSSPDISNQPDEENSYGKYDGSDEDSGSDEETVKACSPAIKETGLYSYPYLPPLEFPTEECWKPLPTDLLYSLEHLDDLYNLEDLDPQVLEDDDFYGTDGTVLARINGMVCDCIECRPSSLSAPRLYAPKPRHLLPEWIFS